MNHSSGKWSKACSNRYLGSQGLPGSALGSRKGKGTLIHKYFVKKVLSLRVKRLESLHSNPGAAPYPAKLCLYSFILKLVQLHYPVIYNVLWCSIQVYLLWSTSKKLSFRIPGEKGLVTDDWPQLWLLLYIIQALTT